MAWDREERVNSREMQELSESPTEMGGTTEAKYPQGKVSCPGREAGPTPGGRVVNLKAERKAESSAGNPSDTGTAAVPKAEGGGRNKYVETQWPEFSARDKS